MTTKIDWDIVRPELRTVPMSELIAIVGRAYELLPVEDIPAVLGRHIDIDKLMERAVDLGDRTLLEKAKQFQADSIAGMYFDEFDVNSRNCTDMSGGTLAWIDEALILFDGVTAASQAGDHVEARAVFELLWNLFDRIDEVENIIFFADEHGSWQVWVDYRKVLPAYFATLAATGEVEMYGPRVLEIIERHDRGARDIRVPEARAAALNDEQRQSLDAAIALEEERKRQSELARRLRREARSSR